MVVKAMKDASMCRSCRSLADECGAFEHFEVVSELFRTGESASRNQNKYGLICKIATGNGRLRPGVFGGGFARIVPIFGMIEEVRADELHHPGIAAAIVAQIKDNSVGMIDVSHRGHG